MARSGSRRWAKPVRCAIQPDIFGAVWPALCFILGLWGFLDSRCFAAEERETIAILPFTIYAAKPFERLRVGFQESLSNQLAQRGFRMIPIGVVNQHPYAFLTQLDMTKVIEMGESFNADWIVSGSITQIGERFSVDLNIFDVTNRKKPRSLFLSAETIDLLPETANRLAVSIDNEISEVPQIESVQIKGNQRIEKEAILVVVQSKGGDRIDYERLDKDLKDIYRMGYFDDVQIETEEGMRGKIVIFNVKEKPSIGRIVFEGNRKIKEKDLKEELGIKVYSILDENEIKQGANRLRDFYHQKGYFNVEIQEKIEPLPNNEVLLRYEISEEKKVYITRIQFEGNETFDPKELKKVMETSEKGLFTWITKSGVLDQKKLEFDVHKLTAFYNNHGFIKAKVGEPRVDFDKEKGLSITIEIDEGPQYGVGKVAVEGDLIRPRNELMARTKIGREKIFNREMVRNDVLSLRDIYANEGFAYAEVRPLVNEDDEVYLVDITYQISKGGKVRFERINIYGNTITRDKVIRRELRVIEGEYYSGGALKSSITNLHRLGFFEDVEVQTKKGSAEDLMVLDIKVKEQSTGSFSLGGGYSSLDGPFGVFEVGESNLFGYGLKLKGSVRIGGRTNEFDIRFVEPWFLDRPLSLGLDIYNLEVEFDEYTKDSVGGAVRLGFPIRLDEFTRGSVKYNYDDAEISDVAETASVAIKDMVGRNVTSSTTFEMTRDSRDRMFNATRGSINTLSFEYAGGLLGGDVGFNRYEARTTWFFPLIWTTVFMAQGRGGFIDQREGEKLPVFQKYRLGGINTVRGYEFGSISPVDPATGDRIGGEKMLNFNFELRFPLLKEQGVMGVVFFDAGQVWTEAGNYNLSDLRRSVGPGVRWYSPLGPLRLEYGWALDAEEGEKKGRWEFSVGGFF